MTGKKGKEIFPAGLRVLLVEDNPTTLLVMRRRLEVCQYHVTACTSGMEALAKLRAYEGKFDIIISNVKNHAMDGFKLLRTVSKNMDIPIVMISACDEINLVMKCLDDGACDYLVKPPDENSLKHIWQHVYRRREVKLNPQLNLGRPHDRGAKTDIRVCTIAHDTRHVDGAIVGGDCAIADRTACNCDDVNASRNAHVNDPSRGTEPRQSVAEVIFSPHKDHISGITEKQVPSYFCRLQGYCDVQNNLGDKKQGQGTHSECAGSTLPFYPITEAPPLAYQPLVSRNDVSIGPSAMPHLAMSQNLLNQTAEWPQFSAQQLEHYNEAQMNILQETFPLDSVNLEAFDQKLLAWLQCYSSIPLAPLPQPSYEQRNHEPINTTIEHNFFQNDGSQDDSNSSLFRKTLGDRVPQAVGLDGTRRDIVHSSDKPQGRTSTNSASLADDEQSNDCNG